MRVFFIILFSVLLQGVIAQTKSATITKVDASAVPAAVVSAFTAQFPGNTASQWEQHAGTGEKGKSFSKYVAIFQMDGAKARARYTAEGTFISSTVYMTAEQIPSTISEPLLAKHVGYTLTSGEKIVVAKFPTTGYRIRLRKGSTKITTVVDVNGNELSKDQFKEADTE